MGREALDARVYRVRAVRPLWILLVLLPLAIGGVAAFAWMRTGQDRYRALEQEGIALAGLVEGAAHDAAEALTTAEAGLADRLAAVARRADEAVARTRAPAAEVLAPIAAEEKVARIFLFDDQREPVARVQYPPPVRARGDGLLDPERKAALEWREATAALGATAPAAGEVRIEGVRENAFGTRSRFGVFLGRATKGTLLLRASAEELKALEARFGLQPVLARVAEVPGVEHIRVAPDANATSGVALEGPLLRIRRPVQIGEQTLGIDLGMARARADEAVSDTRRSILLGALLAIALTLGAGVVLLVRDAAVQRTEAAAAARLEEERRLAEMGALAGLVTHEVSNPMNAIRMALGVLEDRHPGDEPDEILEIMKGEVERVRTTLDGYMALAGSDRRGRTSVEPAVIERVVAALEHEAEQASVSLEAAISGDAAPALANAVVLEQALLNLARNAIQACSADGHVTLRYAMEGGAPTIRVQDDGPGFPEDRAALLRLGGKHREGGHGLGLPLAKRFIEAHGGRMELEDMPTGGAQVRVTLPPATEDATA